MSKHRPDIRLPPEVEESLQRAVRMQWTTIGFLLSIIAVMYLTMGNSRAMRTGWFEDMLSLVPRSRFWRRCTGSVGRTIVAARDDCPAGGSPAIKRSRPPWSSRSDDAATLGCGLGRDGTGSQILLPAGIDAPSAREHLLQLDWRLRDLAWLTAH